MYIKTSYFWSLPSYTFLIHFTKIEKNTFVLFFYYIFTKSFLKNRVFLENIGIINKNNYKNLNTNEVKNLKFI